MLAELRIKLEADTTDFGYYQSSNMQGVLMERLESTYAEQLHESGLKPYSQYIIGTSQKEWIVNTLTQEAYERIMLPLLDETFTDFRIEKKNINVVTDEWFRDKTGRNAREIFEMIQYLIGKAKINAKKEDWQSYERINEKIVQLLR